MSNKDDFKYLVCVDGTWNVPSFPMQVRKRVPLIVAEEAYKEYRAQYGSEQSLKRLGERGGFGAAELAILLCQRIRRLESIIEQAKQ